MRRIDRKTHATKEFQDQRPHVHVHVFDADLEQRVEAGKLDMGLGFLSARRRQ
jgi:hypothetical protein